VKTPYLKVIRLPWFHVRSIQIRNGQCIVEGRVRDKSPTVRGVICGSRPQGSQSLLLHQHLSFTQNWVKTMHSTKRGRSEEASFHINLGLGCQDSSSLPHWRPVSIPSYTQGRRQAEKLTHLRQLFRAKNTRSRIAMKLLPCP
jgi:hypothetical protein